MILQNWFLLCLLSFIYCSPSLEEREQSDFELWVSHYLPHADDPTQHYQQWKRNKEYVSHHNSLQLGYSLHMNQFAHLARHDLHTALAKHGVGDIARSNDSNAKIDPSEVDWRKKGVVTAVQYDGCSQVLTLVDAVSSLRAIQTGNLVPYSGEEVTDCCFGCLCNPGPSQSNPPTTCVAEFGGFCRDIDYPWTSNMCMCHECNGGRLNVKGYQGIVNGSEKDLAHAVVQQPVMVAIDSSVPSFQLYKSGIYQSVNCSSTKLDHMMLVVGYGSQNGQDYWLCKNCWGRGWGMDGYVMMARNKNNMCGIATKASYPIN